MVTRETMLTDVAFLSLAFYGIYYPLSRIELTQKQLVFVLLLLSLPSFSVWTSVIGKEAVGVFFMGLLLGYIIDVVDGRRWFVNLKEVVGVYLLIIFKPHYAIGIAHAALLALLRLKFRRWPGLVLTFFVLVMGLDIGLLYFFRGTIDELSLEIVPHFSPDSASTRPNTIWVNQYDVFYNAPYGMMIGFMGPTIVESLAKPLQGLVLLESLVAAMGILVLAAAAILPRLLVGRLNVLFFSVFLSLFFWVLFVHYPFGALNPGSAIRYRSNFYHVFVIISMFFWVKFHAQQRLERELRFLTPSPNVKSD